MTPRETVLRQIRHEETDRVPYTLDMEGDIGERLDAHYGGSAWRARLTNYFAWVPALRTLVHEPIGDGRARDLYGTIWRLDKRPWHLEQPALSEPSLDGFEFPPAEVACLPLEPAREVCAAHADRFRIVSAGWGLFESSWGLRGFENVMIDAVASEAFYLELMERLTELFLAWVDHACQLDIDGLFFGDDWGDQRGIILGPDRWRKLQKPFWARIYQRVHDHGKLAMTHCCGSFASILPDLIEIGLDVIESCQPEAVGMNPYGLKREFGRDICFWGGLGSQSLIPHGTPEQLAAEVRRLRREMSVGGGYILAPAKPLQPETPLANAVALVEAFAEA